MVAVVWMGDERRWQRMGETAGGGERVRFDE